MIIVTGLSHHTADISIREQVAMSAEEEVDLLGSLLGLVHVGELFVVSTCNRVEIIAATVDDAEPTVSACVAACRAALLARCERAHSSIYTHRDENAVRHLVKVASSLDSLVVGEAQILGQIKQAYERAKNSAAVGPVLHQLLTRVTRGAKRVRNETSIGVGQVSVPSIAVDLALQIFGELRGRRAVLVGAGEMGQMVARLLSDAGAKLKVVGRDLERTRPVAQAVGGSAHLMSELSTLLLDAEIVVSSTAAQEHVITQPMLAPRLKQRRRANLFLIDLAVPRDVDPRVGDMEGVFRYDVDDLSHVALQSAELRKKEADAARVIVEQVVSDWQRHAQTQQVTPTIKALRAKFRLGLEAELYKSLRTRLKDLTPEQRTAVAKMLDAGINRILHGPITHLRNEALRPDASSEDMAEMLDEVFELRSIETGELDVPSVRLIGEGSPAAQKFSSAPPQDFGSTAPPSDDSAQTKTITH